MYPEVFTMTSLSIKKYITLAMITLLATPTLYCFDLQREYPYLSLLIHNANAPAFTKKLDQLVASPAVKSPEFREMLTTLDRDVDHALLTMQAMHGADMSGSIADNGISQCKWAVGELALAAILFKLHPEFKPEKAKIYYGMLATGFGSGILGLISLKNSVTTYFLARRYGKHVQTTLESLGEIQNKIKLHSNAAR